MLDDDVALTKVAAARTHVRAWLDGRHLDQPCLLGHDLDGHDRVRAFGDDAARRDGHRLAGRERSRRRVPGGDPSDDREPPWCVGGTQRKAVHRGAGERRQIDRRARSLREDASRGVGERHGL